MSTADSTLTRLRVAAGLRTVSRRKIIEVLKTLVAVVPLTLLIWIYAEREQAAPDEVRNIQIALTPSDPGMTATVTEPADATVKIGLFGPRGQIDQLKARLENETQGHRLELKLPAADSSTGEHTVDLVRLLNDDPLISSSGVTVMRETTSPVQASVSVDQLVVRDATIVQPHEAGQGLENVTFDPPRVTFRGPAAAMNGQFPADGATVAVDLQSVLNQLTPGKHTVEVPLPPPRDPRISASATRVKMAFDLASQERTETLRNVAIDVRRPVGQDGRSKVVIKGSVAHNIRIRGPDAQVRRYAGDNPEQLLTAVLTVGQSDVGRTGLQRDLSFPDLPPGVSVVDGPYPVEFDVRDIKDVAPDADR